MNAVMGADDTAGDVANDAGGGGRAVPLHERGVIAVGDGRNDIEMFHWAKAAGRAVAMGQAPAHVQAVADEVGPTVLEDGAAQVLNRFFPS